MRVQVRDALPSDFIELTRRVSPIQTLVVWTEVWVRPRLVRERKLVEFKFHAVR
jgi:hypothetical protein